LSRSSWRTFSRASRPSNPAWWPFYHFTDVEAGEEVTAIVWEDEAARVAYRQSELIKEALELEQRLGLASKREPHPLTLALH
jgi:hypothetical protein